MQLAVVADPAEAVLPLPGGSSVLGLAIRKGRSPAFLRELIGVGALVDGVDSIGRTPLQIVLDAARDIQGGLELGFWQRDIQGGLEPGFRPREEVPLLRARQALLVRQALALLSAGATVPVEALGAARGNHACALCVQEYWDALAATVIHRAILSGRFNEQPWGVIATFLYNKPLGVVDTILYTYTGA